VVVGINAFVLECMSLSTLVNVDSCSSANSCCCPVVCQAHQLLYKPTAPAAAAAALEHFHRIYWHNLLCNVMNNDSTLPLVSQSVKTQPLAKITNWVVYKIES